MKNEDIDDLFTIIIKKREVIIELEKHIKELTESKDNAYKERDLLVVVLSKIFPAYKAKHPEEDKEWEDDWRTIIFIDIPISKSKTAQVSWHIHDSEIGFFKHLKEGKNDWDGHTTKEKYKRLKRIKIDGF